MRPVDMRALRAERHPKHGAARWLPILVCVPALVACGSGQRALAAGPEVIGSTSAPPTPYVIRMSDGDRDWEVEIPEASNGYEARIPLRTGGRGGQRGQLTDLADPLTSADRELLTERRRHDDEFEGEGVFRGDEDLVDSRTGGTAESRTSGGDADEPSDAEPAGERARRSDEDTEPAPSRPSYLLGIAEVRRLYRAGNLEVAMVRLSSLLEAYPGDLRLLAMKGTLWMRLGRPELARRAWEQVLQEDPGNRTVRAALRRLNEASDEAAGEDDSL